MTTGQLSRAGAGFGASHEACYLYAYPDPGTGRDPWTIGVGHTARAGPPVVRRGDRVTLQRGFEIYADDMGNVEIDVRRVIKPQLKQHQFDAACVFHLNTGAIGSGSVDDKLNRGDEAGALATWGQYINAGGRPMTGLKTRRAEEIALWKTGRYPARRVLIKDTPTGSGRTIAATAIPWRGDAPAPAARVEAERPPVIIARSPVPVGVVATATAAVSWYTRLMRFLITG